ncbi:MAG: hypothetical protein ABJ360_16420 [Roseobacter sp.]|uniref:hypothetical protein n=1 Tax=Tateyamaria sp. TaxID=1929288 RepID=UPI0032891B18
MKLRYLAVTFGCFGLAAAEPVSAQTLSTLGTLGLIDMPTAEVLEDGSARRPQMGNPLILIM